LLFFHGGHDDLAVGLIWHPRHEKQKFRTGLPFNLSRVASDEGTDMVELNRKTVLLEIARIGGDMIKRIE
jgi:U3 small nucleolar RNA-associated protein 22